MKKQRQSKKILKIENETETSGMKDIATAKSVKE